MKKCNTLCPERLGRVGGQAVLEGVMMKAGDRTVTTCRKEDGSLVISSSDFVSVRKKHKILDLPILRGVVNFIEMMSLSVKILGESAKALGIEEEEETKDETPAPTTSAQDNHIFSSVNIEKNSGIFYSFYTFAAVLNPQNGDSLDYDLNETFKVTLTVEMPTEITGAKGGTVEGNKVIFDIADITTTQELAATCEENNTGLVIGIVIGLVILAGGLVFLFKHKK